MDGRKVVCYHNACSDGMTAAFIAKLWHEKHGFEQPEFVPVNPKVTPDIDPTGANIIMFDTCLDRKSLLEWKKKAVCFHVWDHHKSNQEEFRDLNDICYFDMNKSGASLAWEFYFEGEPEPWWVSYTQDRDLWTWKLPNSKEVNAFLISLELDFKSYEVLKTATLTGAEEIGRELLKSDETKISRAMKGQHFMMLDGHLAAVVNSPNFQSELGNKCAELAQLGIAWFVTVGDDGDWGAQVSLRSIGDFDVTKIAIKYGGGGHKNAAGCRIPLKEWISMINY
jgi:nanoRNase/pAp phosphatase (c-di-AMP/oligoRNAs hydrolase)